MSLRRLESQAPDEDFEGLMQMCAEHAAFERLSFERDGQVERWREDLARERVVIWVVEEEGRLIGFAAVSREYSTWRAAEYLHLDCLFLRSTSRGSGWGSRLMKKVRQYAHASGCDQVQWQTPPWNEKALAFYARQGASSQPKQRFSIEPEA